MDVEELLALRQKIDEVIPSKAPEVEAKIAPMQETLKGIKPARE